MSELKRSSDIAMVHVHMHPCLYCSVLLCESVDVAWMYYHTHTQTDKCACDRCMCDIPHLSCLFPISHFESFSRPLALSSIFLFFPRFFYIFIHSFIQWDSFPIDYLFIPSLRLSSETKVPSKKNKPIFIILPFFPRSHLFV